MTAKIKILYEDTNILAIEKPSGVSVHADGRTKDKTLVDWILKNYPKMKNVGENEVYEYKGKKVEIKKPGIVHRLDRDTSGVLLLAKNEKTYQFLKKQFQNREVKKIYFAIVSGNVKNDRGVINKPIGRSPKDFRRYLAGRGARGEVREAVTEYRVLKRLPGFTILEVRPKTGRTHQIRVHMKYINHPIAGDALYNPEGLPLPNLPLGKGEEKGGGRMMLHAKSIEFKNPKGGMVKVESKIPKEFEKLIK